MLRTYRYTNGKLVPRGGTQKAHLKSGTSFWNTSFSIAKHFHFSIDMLTSISFLSWIIFSPGEWWHFSDTYVRPKLSCWLCFSSRPFYTRDKTEQLNDNRITGNSKLHRLSRIAPRPSFPMWHVEFFWTTGETGVATDRIQLARVKAERFWL